jgi:putative acetyltransferase
MSNAEITLASADDRPQLFEVWEASVRATHLFLSEADIEALTPLVKDELGRFEPVHCLRDAAGRIYAFMGIAAAKIEMLFIDPAHRGRGAGRLLVEFAINVLGADAVDVNEQNVQAVGFYERLGFRRVGRSELDSTGNPFPLLHMKLPPCGEGGRRA